MRADCASQNHRALKHLRTLLQQIPVIFLVNRCTFNQEKTNNMLSFLTLKERISLQYIFVLNYFHYEQISPYDSAKKNHI